MPQKDRRGLRRLIFAAANALALAAGLLPSHAPAQTTPAREDSEEVVRISTSLVQTDVMVFDKQNKFVTGLKPEQFELVVDGKPQPVSFFEHITAGTFDEEVQLAAARGRARVGRSGETAKPLDRGRLYIIFLDDLHIKPSNLQRTREAVLRFVDEQMGQNDSAALFTASGQLGFLEQLTGDKEVLRLAIKRVGSRFVETREVGEQNPITEYQAFAIERGDRTVLNYIMDRVAKERLAPDSQRAVAARSRGAGAVRTGREGTGGLVQMIEQLVKARARAIVDQAQAATKNTLTSLNNVVSAASALPGRKVLFFISDGFYADAQVSFVTSEMRRISSSAARSGTILYSIDSQGLRTSTLIKEAGERVTFDSTNDLVPSNSAELTAYQEPLYTLAAESGGRALIDTNDLIPAISNAVNETAQYYLLAWRPEGETPPGGKFYPIEVRVKGRPDLSVRVRRGASTEPPDDAASLKEREKEKERKKKSKDKKSEIEEGLMAALKSLYPRRDLPTSIAAGFTDTPGSDPTLTVSVEVDPHALGIAGAGARDSAALDIIGAIINDEGKSVSEFEQNLAVTQVEQSATRRRVVYNHQLQLKPGLYQVRVAARERRNGSAGSASQWLEVPDVKKGGLTLSSLFLGETGDGSSQLAVCADKRFSRASRLGFFLYVYNASRAASAPDVALQVQVFRDGQPVITRPLLKIETAGMQDLARLPYGEDLALESLPAGRYVLQVTAIDRAGKSSASQRTNFVVE